LGKTTSSSSSALLPTPLISLSFRLAYFGDIAMLRILIADDVPLVRTGLKLLLETHKDWIVCGEAEDGQDAVRQALILHPDVVLLDVSMPNLNGLQAAELIKRDLPEASIYFVTQHHSLEIARLAAQAGATGYIAKIHVPTDLIAAIEAAARKTGKEEPVETAPVPATP
jgi:DNA-binding NarL/FixJ family response regulator